MIGVIFDEGQALLPANEVMNLPIQHEFYKEVLGDPEPGRMVEQDAEECHREEEKIFEDDEMWTKGW